MSFQPNYSITPKIANALMEIEAGRKSIELLPVSAELLESLRESARLISTHYSTAIEGNRLTQEEVQEVLVNHKKIPNRERDEVEVRNYYRALDHLDNLSKHQTIAEVDIRLLHGLSYMGTNKPTAYRDGQNVIRDSNSGRIVYLPPEAKDIGRLMSQLVKWLDSQIAEAQLPIPIIAAIAHYQFATIHPYFDGNGRTARLLTTLILHQNGYGLKGIYSLDEYYAKNLNGYYDALTIGHHNYYFGRETEDITGFVEYFCMGMAKAVSTIKIKANASSAGKEDLRHLKPQQRKILSLFKKQAEVTSQDIAKYLKINHRAGRDLARKWAQEGFLVVVNGVEEGEELWVGYIR